jgi:hypothetical protein
VLARICLLPKTAEWLKELQPVFLTCMSQNHQHDNCSPESNDSGLDHSHDSSADVGPQDNLFAYIDRENVVALNASAEGSVVIKPWNERLEETKVCRSPFILLSFHLMGCSSWNLTPTIKCRMPFLLPLLFN